MSLEAMIRSHTGKAYQQSGGPLIDQRQRMVKPCSVASLINPVFPGDFSLQERRAIKAVILYEGTSTGQRAMITCKRLIRRLGQDFEFETSLWNFDVLCLPVLKQMAAQDAADANLVIIATHGQRVLPREVRFWLKSWLSQKREGIRALVALLASAGGESTGKSYLLDYLQEAAQNANIDFFSHTFPDLPDNGSSADNPATEVNAAAVMFEQRRTTYADWGINE